MSLYDNSQVTEKSSIKPALKVENCRLVDIKTESGVNKDTNKPWTCLVFVYKQVSTGDVVEDRIFEPIDQTATPPFKDYDFKQEINRTLGRIKHVQQRYMEPTVADNIKADSWEDLTKAVVNSFPAGYKETPCSLSVVYVKQSNGKYYAGLRKWPPFVSTEKYPKDFSPKLSSGESWDAAEETKSSSPNEPKTNTPATSAEI